ncbi:MAG TPA: hypothetical protein PLF84_23460, partial [Bryobacteraceae bacterium]|nr:hypothetical protein [Bryobacteraceae bacterium]
MVRAETQKGQSDGTGLAAREADNPQAASTRGRGYGGDRVVLIHGANRSGGLTSPTAGWTSATAAGTATAGTAIAAATTIPLETDYAPEEVRALAT